MSRREKGLSAVVVVIIILVVIVVLAAAAAAVYYLTDVFNKPKTVELNLNSSQDVVACDQLLSDSPSEKEKAECVDVGGSIYCGEGWCFCSCPDTSQNLNLEIVLNQNENVNQNLNQNLNSSANSNTNVDSDNDGLTDGQELLYGTDPTDKDSDNDGYLDGEEVESGYNPMGEGKLSIDASRANYEDWNLYINDVYNYQFYYPDNVEVEGIGAAAFDLNITQEQRDQGLSFQDLYEQYTEKICITVQYGVEQAFVGYIQISAAANEGYEHVVCGRTGLGYDGEEISETITIEDLEYTATGYEEMGPGETLDYHNEVLVINLDDGTRIEFGALPESSWTFDQYQEQVREDLIKMVESFSSL